MDGDPNGDEVWKGSLNWGEVRGRGIVSCILIYDRLPRDPPWMAWN